MKLENGDVYVFAVLPLYCKYIKTDRVIDVLSECSVSGKEYEALSFGRFKER